MTKLVKIKTLIKIKKSKREKFCNHENKRHKKYNETLFFKLELNSVCKEVKKKL